MTNKFDKNVKTVKFGQIKQLERSCISCKKLNYVCGATATPYVYPKL